LTRLTNATLLISFSQRQPVLGWATREVRTTLAMPVMDRQRQRGEGRVGSGPAFKPRHLLNVVLHQINSLLQGGTGWLHVVFEPLLTRPTHDLDSEELRVIGKTRLFKRPVDHQKVLQLLAHSRVFWSSELESNQRPSVLMEDGHVGCGIELNAANINGGTTVKKRPTPGPTGEQWTQSNGALKSPQLPKTPLNALQAMQRWDTKSGTMHGIVHQSFKGSLSVRVRPDFAGVLVLKSVKPRLAHCSNQNLIVGPRRLRRWKRWPSAVG
tara:strand:- start:136 stop:939 length:804 start_codon:yes stop_codon:yes gene_type:complete